MTQTQTAVMIVVFTLTIALFGYATLNGMVQA